MFNISNTGQRIAFLRMEKGLTQEQMADLLGVTGQAVSKWEKGRALPDTALLPIIAKVLDTSIDRLLTGQDVVIPASPYDNEYEKQEYYWGLQQSVLAEQIVNLMGSQSAGKRLLDIGSGEGRDSIYFAKGGFLVDALEISLPGIEKTKRYSQLNGLSISTIHANMIGYELTDDYDVIYSMGALQFLPVDQRLKHFERYKEHTQVGGLNAHLVFVEKPFIPLAPDWEKNEFFYRSGDLAGYYHDWEIICYDEQIIDCMSANISHQHAVSSIIARKIE